MPGTTQIEPRDLMHATVRKRPFSDRDWLYELKYLCVPQGHRMKNCLHTMGYEWGL